MFVSLSVGGLMQGWALENPDIPFLASTNFTLPFLWIRSVSGIMLTAGHVAFAASFALILLKAGTRHERPTLLANPDEAAA